ncbi:MAG: hypothetical protein N2053_04845, partial [Chitinispirillaceae bacterium]|nr:hypothetical protein [Chitinispirillaceae bacterium]
MRIECDLFGAIRFLLFSFIIISLGRLIYAQDYTDEEVLKAATEKGKLAANYWVKNSGKDPGTTDYYAEICAFYGAC